MTVKSGKMIANAIDRQKYAALLADTVPFVIKDDAELERMTEVANQLVTKGIKQNGLSPEEDRLLELVSQLIIDFETKHYSIPDAAPHEIIQHFLDARELRQKDLLPVFGSEGIISEVLKGKRNITIRHVKLLAQFFNVPAETFI